MEHMKKLIYFIVTAFIMTAVLLLPACGLRKPESAVVAETENSPNAETSGETEEQPTAPEAEPPVAEETPATAETPATEKIPVAEETKQEPSQRPEPDTTEAGRNNNGMEGNGINGVKSIIPGVSPEMQRADFWLKLYEARDEVILSAEGIRNYNTYNISRLPFLSEVDKLPDTVSGKEVARWINQYCTPPQATRYDERGTKYQAADYAELLKNVNLEGIPDTIGVRYGVAVKRTQMRTWPSPKQSFSVPDNRQIDRFMETAVYAAEPIVIYHTSRDGQWYFAESYYYRAWIPAEDVALCTADEFQIICLQQNFIVVTGAVIKTPESADSRISRLQLDMGVRLSVVNEDENRYMVQFPVRGENAGVEFKTLPIQKSEDVSAAYHDYKTSAILNQAFKFLGEVYGWGGMNNARDCSSFLVDVYKTVGIILPRNSDQQEQIKGAVSLKGKTREQRIKILDKLRPGSTLYMSGHAMMYLGKWQGKHYIIHDATTVYQKEQGGSLKPYVLNQVAVTPVDVCNSKGDEYLMLLNTAVSIE